MPDMYAFQAASKQSPEHQTDAAAHKCTPNILPCRIHHDGPIESPDRFWSPVANEKDSTQTAHFRGRKLRGRRVAIPDGYRGLVATPTDRVMPPSDRPDNNSTEDAGSEPEEPVKILETQGEFGHLMVWGHEILPAADDAFVKGVEEWVRFAETMHTVPASNP